MKTPFKTDGELKLMTVSQRQMAACLGLSTTRVNQLIDEGILIRDPSTNMGRLMLIESLQNYFLSKNGSGEESVSFWKERALHEKANRQMAELKLRERRGELLESKEVEAFITELITTTRQKFLGAGHKLAPRLEGLPAAQMCSIIDEEIYEILRELANNAGNMEGVGAACADDGE